MPSLLFRRGSKYDHVFGVVYGEECRDRFALVDIDQRPNTGLKFGGGVVCEGKIYTITHEEVQLFATVPNDWFLAGEVSTKYIKEPITLPFQPVYFNDGDITK